MDRPKIITMCGSTRFTAEMLDEAWRLTKLENIVIHWNILNSSAAFAHGAEREGGNIKEIIDRLYLHKVAMADEIRVINVGGYIGDSTRAELRHAKRLGKPITWIEPEKVDPEFITAEIRPEDVQTCPRRAEGLGYGVEGEDRWETKHWRYTDEEEARKGNEAEQLAEGRDLKYCNTRYWLWPGPGEKPRTCSYCGCINPVDALYLKKNHKFEIGSTTKGYKVYIEPPGYGMEQLNSLTNMQAGVDPVESFSKNKVQTIYPPLKAYSPHFTPDQWRELIS